MRKSLDSILCLALCLCVANSINFFNQVSFSNKTGAMCLDGSPYSIYIYTPDPLDVKFIPNKLLIYWEEVDFGWCYKDNLADSIHSCYEWIVQDNLIDHGSSINWPSNFMFLKGVLSLQEGGQFQNWPKVFIKSCDGGSYMGNSAPIKYKGKNLHFKGSQNIIQAVNYLNKINFLKNRQQIVMMGTFNAGIGALLWSDYIKSQTSGKFRVIADGALFLNSFNYKHNASYIQERMKMVEKFNIEYTTFPNPACEKANQGQLWKCLFVEQLIKYVKVPVYFMQSLYDGWDISQILGFYCTEEWGSLAQCTAAERDIIQDYHHNVTKVLNNILSLHPEHGAFAISCVAHQFTGGKWNNQLFQVPMNSKIRPINATSAWIKGISRQLHIDTTDWPNNKPCARKVKEQQISEENLLKQ